VATVTEPASVELWGSLRRRKIVQWGVAYVAAAWALLQGLAYLSSVFHWSMQLQRPATTAFLVGLPIALVLAWYHGDRGHQRVTGREFAILIVLLLLGGGLFWWVGRLPDVTDVPAAAGSSATAPPQVPALTGTSIAVLPFVNMSDDKGNEYFSDGISEELLNVLVRVDGLGVASRTSSFGYKNSPLGTAAIAQALKVNHVLEGSVRKSGNHVRITAQLIDAVHDRHLWSETYDRELTDIFAIQEEIANAIVDALRTQLGTAKKTVAPVTVRVDTKNVEAYALYLKARELFIARKDLPESIRLFEQVTRMDPDFARGWEGLAAVASVAPSWAITDRDYTAMAQQAAKRALEIDPSLSMPWAALGNSYKNVWPVDWSGQFQLLDRAVAADPRNATAYLFRGISWLDVGFFERALADFNRCLELEPNYSNALRHKALALLYLGKADEALDLFERGVARGFILSRAENFVAPLIARGDLLAAHLLLDRIGFAPEVRDMLIDAIRRPHPVRREEVANIERYLADHTDLPDLQLVRSHPYLWLGDFERVGRTDERVTLELLSWERYPPGYRNSPGFKRKLEAKGVLAYWRTKGFPPQCRALGEKDFTCD
jgi:TolB-like protein